MKIWMGRVDCSIFMNSESGRDLDEEAMFGVDFIVFRDAEFIGILDLSSLISAKY